MVSNFAQVNFLNNVFAIHLIFVHFRYRQLLGLSLLLLFYFSFSIPVYISGFVAGVLFTLSLVTMYNKIFGTQPSLTDLTFSMPVYNSQAILEIPAVKEYQPVAKFEVRYC